MKSIVRRDTGEDWKEYVTRLMREEGVIDASHEPTAEEVRRFDKKRKNKKVSNEDWKSATDGDARITQMKDGTTHLAYKAEHVVDLTGDLILAAEIYPGDQADTATLADSAMVAAQIHLKEAGSDARRSKRRRRTRVIDAAGAIELLRVPGGADVHPRAAAAAPVESGPTSRTKHRRAVVNQPPAGAAGQVARSCNGGGARWSNGRARRIVCETGGACDGLGYGGWRMSTNGTRSPPRRTTWAGCCAG